MNIRNDYSGKRFGKYYLIQKLGNGGFGSVYKVFDNILGVEKALKILEVSNPEEAYKLFSEAAIPYKCQHNHVIKINSGEIIKYNGELLFVIDMLFLSVFERAKIQIISIALQKRSFFSKKNLFYNKVVFLLGNV